MQNGMTLDSLVHVLSGCSWVQNKYLLKQTQLLKEIGKQLKGAGVQKDLEEMRGKQWQTAAEPKMG